MIPWQLPEGIEALLPPQAEHLERVRRRILDGYLSWGYRYVIPPVIEYLEVLQTVSGTDLEAQTLKLVDPLNGKLLGFRADITPQVSRLEAHHLNQTGVVRLCYLGTVLRAYPAMLGGTRSPLQIGAELYGYESIEGDLEILSLMIETLKLAGIDSISIDLGHVKVVESILELFPPLSLQDRQHLLDILRRKAQSDLPLFFSTIRADSTQKRVLSTLLDLFGDFNTVLDKIQKNLLDEPIKSLLFSGHEKTFSKIHAARRDLEKTNQYLEKNYPEVLVHVDLAENPGYQYHTGMRFSAYTAGYGQALAQGGRYDDTGELSDRSRPATGFTTDLKTLIAVAEETQGIPRTSDRIIAPWEDDPDLKKKIEELRAQGECVCVTLPGETTASEENPPHRQLRKIPSLGWQVVAS